MEVITDRPIYNYASGGDNFSYLTEEEEKARAERKSAKKQKRQQWWEKAKGTAQQIKESDYTKALAGVGAQKVQNWASTGSGTGAGTGGQNLNSLITYEKLPDVTDSKDEKGDGKGMGIWTKVAIGVGIVTVLGVATYFILKSKKGKSAKK